MGCTSILVRWVQRVLTKVTGDYVSTHLTDMHELNWGYAVCILASVELTLVVLTLTTAFLLFTTCSPAPQCFPPTA
jgi:hypothetical protein